VVQGGTDETEGEKMHPIGSSIEELCRSFGQEVVRLPSVFLVLYRTLGKERIEIITLLDRVDHDDAREIGAAQARIVARYGPDRVRFAIRNAYADRPSEAGTQYSRES
jgi:hypothetical protein